jgi:glycosyltransferase involved in cell wall biosynthesis
MMLAVLTTVYPAALPFLDDFLEGLQNQSDSNFTLFIVNDGVEGLEGLPSGKNFDTRILKASGTPAALRRQGINWVTEDGAEWVVFADADDVCSTERVARTRGSIDGVDGLFNDLIIFNDQSTVERSLFSTRFSDGDFVRSSNLVNKNFLGLSNTAAKASLLRYSASHIPEDVIAFDWALYTRMVLENATICYMDGAPTYYRQHRGNVAGLGNISNKQIFKGTRIKARHYDLFRPHGDPYDRLADDFVDLVSRLELNGPFFRDYCRAVRKNSLESHLWWEAMKLPKEIGL